MAAPPGAAHAQASPAGSWHSAPGVDRDQLIAAGHTILSNVGVSMSASRVRRMVQTFERRVAANGFSFFEFVANTVVLSAEQRRAALCNPEVARAIAYADPTGEAAVNNVMRGAR